MSQRKYCEESDALEQAKDFDNLESQDIFQWRVESSVLNPGHMTPSQPRAPHRKRQGMSVSSTPEGADSF